MSVVLPDTALANHMGLTNQVERRGSVGFLERADRAMQPPFIV